MKSIHFKNLSANTIQLIINQAFGLAVFYSLSTYLAKSEFGQLNFVLAILLTAFNVLSCGIDQLIVKKIASGVDELSTITLYLTHVFISGLLFYGLLIGAGLVFPVPLLFYQLLIIVGAGKVLLFFSTPFKQFAVGKEKFAVLAKMSVTSSCVKCLLLISVALFYKLTLSVTAFVFFSADALEFLIALYLYKIYFTLPLTLKWELKPYISLMKEAAPQVGVMLFTSALARFDWIFIGIFSTSIKLAEYSFAYKVFEISTLPLLALAPLLLPRFVRSIKEHHIFPARFFELLKLEIMGSAFIAMLLFLCWSAVIDGLTANKYGAVNLKVVMVLALCMPLMYFNNFAWSIFLAQNKLKLIFKIFAVTFAVNVTGDVLLIPLIGNIGAAWAYLAAILIQAVLFIYFIKSKGMFQAAKNLIVCLIIAVVCVFTAKRISNNTIVITLSAVVIYWVLLFAIGQLIPRKIKLFILALE